MSLPPLPPLPPVPAPDRPERGQRFDVGSRFVPERHTVVAVTGPSFTVLHAGRRQRHDRATWHAWLQGLCGQGEVWLDGRRLLPPGPAPLVLSHGPPSDRVHALPATPGPQEEADMRPEDRRARLHRAVHEVLHDYRIQPEDPGRDGRLRFCLHGGSDAWLVEVDPKGSGPPTCTCPDFARYHGAPGERAYPTGEHASPHACKHILAVLLREPDLRFQALDFFL